MPWFSCFGRRASSPAGETDKVDEEVSGIHNVRLYMYKELKNATDDFSPANKIGEGGFGSVYKGRLKDGTIAAIKVLAAESKQGVREFLTEINVISNIEHEYLVKLYGCCVEANHRILVYNFLENNSLAQTLLAQHNCSVFDFLLNQMEPKGFRTFSLTGGGATIYCSQDIKASNILLDGNLNPKIADFGLAKLIPSNMTHVSTRVAGTIGYLAPEYAIRGQLTRKADIYSFGVLLVEIVCGRCNTNTRLPIGEQYLLERSFWQRLTRSNKRIRAIVGFQLSGEQIDTKTIINATWELYERKELVGLVDESLNGAFDAEEACRFLKIGLLCTQDTPKLRPSMSSVVKMLIGEMDVDSRAITKPGLISDSWTSKSEVNPNLSLMRRTYLIIYHLARISKTVQLCHQESPSLQYMTGAFEHSSILFSSFYF
ncbi:Cold-responsive protein kinase 1 [Vitis vinifera]|uniref:Cold-responsive protein kinase 1 n=1 Tax=Vitis vinifera TaxID=29760 RepID=A0A438H230_VITVI|nr:Cold-responsive protein kinase 1 [Vitis vinifera]